MFSHSVMSNSLQLHELQHARLPCPSLSLRVCSDSCPVSRWCQPAISSSVAPFSSCPQSFPASGSFPVSQLFELSGQSIRASASASVLPMNLQGWFLLGLTGWISLLSKGLSRVFSLRKIMHGKSWAQFLAYRESLIFKAFDPALPNPSLLPFSNSEKSALLAASNEEQAYFLSHRGAPCSAVELGSVLNCSVRLPVTPMDSSPSASSVHGIFQARVLEWVFISSFRGSSRARDWTRVSRISCIGRQILYHWATRKETVVSKERELGGRGGETAEPSRLFENIIFSFMNSSQV